MILLIARQISLFASHYMPHKILHILHFHLGLAGALLVVVSRENVDL